MIRNIGFKSFGSLPHPAQNVARHSLLDLQNRKLESQAQKEKYKVFIIVGTRPELIKLAPVIKRLKLSEKLDTRIVNTGQHVELVNSLYQRFGLTPDFDCELLHKGQTLVDSYAKALERLGRLVSEEKPDLILVQGDTLSAAAAALVGFLNLVPVGLIEAGLRTFNILSPFPEELNRILIGQVATFHFAPTQRGSDNLLKAGVVSSDIFLTGNTVVDALREVLATSTQISRPEVKEFLSETTSKRKVLLTLHRRENQEGKLEVIFAAIAWVAKEHEKCVKILFPMHLTPLVRECASRHLQGLSNVILCEPIDYTEFVSVLQAVDFIVTDSGGIQEEALALEKPILVFRENTERPEIIEAGLGHLVGNDLDLFRKVFASLASSDPGTTRTKLSLSRPYGIGNAAERISSIIDKFFDGKLKMGCPDLSIIVPCFNEEGNISTLMGTLAKTASDAGINAEIIFVDDNSTDGTFSAGCEAKWQYDNVQVLTKTFPRGMGNAIRFGLGHASADVVLITMGDGSDDLSVVPEMFQLVKSGEVDLAIGSRYRHRANQKNIPPLYRHLSRLFRILGQFMLGIPLRDFTNAYRCFNWKVLQCIGLEGTGFEISPEITFKAWYYRKKVAEVDAMHLKRAKGQSKFSFLKAGPGYGKMMAKALIARVMKSWPYIDW